MAKRNKHSLSHYHLTTANMGQLIPIGCVEALPGDTFQHHANVLIRVSPLVAPVMHPVNARVHHFFIPHRLTWGPDFGDSGTFEDFITGGPTGEDSQNPAAGVTTGAPKDLMDYLGLPRTPGVFVNYMPIRAFNAVFNEFYRDQDLVPEREPDDLTIPQIAWEKDYFSSSRPWPQKGPDVTIPLGATAPIIPQPDGDRIPRFTDGSGTESLQLRMESGSQNVVWEPAPGDTDAAYFENSGLVADLQAAIGGNINDVRKAFAIQRYQEARARYGSRYTEYLRFLGVTPRDSRLQRPEFLGGGRTQIQFSEVLQTSPETRHDDPPELSEFGVGDMYGHGIAAMRSNKYRRYIEEHGTILSLLSVRPKTVYTQGIHRSWLRRDKEDFYQRELEHIGQQGVFNNEVYADAENGQETFGYQDRYREYREHPSYVSAEFRDILNYWHMGREFEAPPVLNQSFIDCVPTKRIHNEQTHDALWIMVQHKMVARRLLSRNAAPRIF